MGEIIRKLASLLKFYNLTNLCINYPGGGFGQVARGVVHRGLPAYRLPPTNGYETPPADDMQELSEAHGLADIGWSGIEALMGKLDVSLV